MARVKRADVQAVFEAFGGGGGALLHHRDPSPGPPADLLGGHSAIRPFEPWDGRCFDAADWHVILIAAVEGGDLPDVEQTMSGLKIRFALDGVHLRTVRTAVKPFPRPEIFGLKRACYFQEGRLIPPFGLGPGGHSLRCVVTADSRAVFDSTIRFFIG